MINVNNSLNTDINKLKNRIDELDVAISKYKK